MGVVAAGVNADVFAVDFEGQRVHVGTQHHCGAGLCTVDVGHNACTADIADWFKAKFGQFGSNIIAGLLLLKAKLRYFVELSSHGNDIKIIRFHEISFIQIY